MILSARERRLQLIGEKASRALGIRSDRLAEHDPVIDESPGVLRLEWVARRDMQKHDALISERRRAMAELEVASPRGRDPKGEDLDS